MIQYKLSLVFKILVAHFDFYSEGKRNYNETRIEIKSSCLYNFVHTLFVMENLPIFQEKNELFTQEKYLYYVDHVDQRTTSSNF